MTVRARLLTLAAAGAVLVAGGLALLAHTQQSGCAVPAPRPSLTAQMRALGDFDQAYDAGNAAAIEDAAQRAATALHADLIGAVPEAPVTVIAASSGAPAALVVPLRSQAPAAAGPAPLAGLVVFLRDCQGNAYFSAVEDDVTRQPPVLRFPGVDATDAAAQLGAGEVRLAYTDDPLRPQWRTVSSPVRSLAAR